MLPHFEETSKQIRARKQRERRSRVKTSILTAYCGGRTPFCRDCGTENESSLILVAVTQKMREIKEETNLSGGYKLYSKLRAAGCPPGFEVQCTKCFATQNNNRYGKRNPFISEGDVIEPVVPLAQHHEERRSLVQDKHKFLRHVKADGCSLCGGTNVAFVMVDPDSKRGVLNTRIWAEETLEDFESYVQDNVECLCSNCRSDTGHIVRAFL